MTTVTFNKRQYTITKVESIEGKHIAADLLARGFEAAFYTLTGKRGGVVIALRGVKSGEFATLY